jgi:hypothetical protein
MLVDCPHAVIRRGMVREPMWPDNFSAAGDANEWFHRAAILGCNYVKMKKIFGNLLVRCRLCPECRTAR